MVGEWDDVLQSANTDMIDDSIFQPTFWLSIPFLIGNFFQQLYNTVDPYVVGDFVNANALVMARVSTPAINILVGFLMGLFADAGAVISQYFGVRQGEAMSRVIRSIMAPTGLLSIVFTGLGLLYTGPPLRAAGVPKNILPHFSLYLMIYFCGITFSLFYNMGSGMLRAVGNSRHSLLYLAMASVVNIILDFTFVCRFHMSITGVAIATIMTQAVSSFMVMHKLMHTREDYRVEIRKIQFRKRMARKIIVFGLPIARQQGITSFSNIMAQSYTNRSGMAAMAEYSAALRIDGFLQLSLQNFDMAIIAFVGQNIGTRKHKRMRKGILTVWVMSSLIILTDSVGMYFGAPLLISVFTSDPQVIGNGDSMLHISSRAYIVMPVIQILNGALRGVGLSEALMFLTLGSFMVLRQIYLFITAPTTHSLMVVMAGWSIAWIIRAAGVFLYYVKVDQLPKKAGPEGG